MMPLSLPSHLRHYLTTNEPPLEVDLEDTRKILHAAQSNLRCFEDDSGLTLSQVEQTKLTKLICECEIILSPQRRLPLDIIRLILIACLPTAWEGNDPFANPPNPFFTTQGSFNMKLAPWVLGHICSYWRSIALSTSSLWSCLNISIASLEHRYARKPFPVTDILKAQLQRSGTHPLTVVFAVSRHCSITLSQNILPLLLSQSHRFKRLYLKANDTIIRQIFQARDSLPLLEHIVITPTTPNATQGFEQVIAPMMHTVRLQRLPPELCRPLEHFKFPWSQITSFRGSDMYARYILAHAPNLQELSGNNYGAGSDFITQPLISHPKLQRLGLGIDCLSAFGSLPSLTALEASGTPRLENPSLITAFVLRTGCSLTFLDISDIRFSTEGEVIEVLQVVPALKELRVFSLSGFESTNRLFIPLTCSSSAAFVPDLEALEIMVQTSVSPQEPTFAYDRLLDMAESRWYRLSRLRRLQFSSTGQPLAQHIIKRIDALRAEGLEIKERTQLYQAVPDYVLK